MNKKTKTNWATDHDYEKAFAYIEEQGKDTTEIRHYIYLLETLNGKTVFRDDLKGWISYLGKTIDGKGFSL